MSIPIYICTCIYILILVACSVCAWLGPYWVGQHKGHHQSQHDQTMDPLVQKSISNPFKHFIEIFGSNKQKSKHILVEVAPEPLSV